MINFSNRINDMTSAYIAQLGFTPRSSNVDTQNMNNLALKTYWIAIARFSI